MPLDIKGIGMTSQRTRDRLAKTLVEMGIKSEAVLDVIRKTPRHFFIDEALASRAYENTALPIGFNQTISQPYIVAKTSKNINKTTTLEKMKKAQSQIQTIQKTSKKTPTKPKTTQTPNKPKTEKK